MKTAIEYSVVIPAYNRSQKLREALLSLSNQTVSQDEYEIIVVDDGSTDDTKKVAEEFCGKHSKLNFKYFYQKNSGCAKARNTGILNAKGQIIFFTDDDCVVPPEWMEKILDAFERYPEAAGVGGWAEPTDEVFQKNRFYQFYRFLARQAYPGAENCEIYTNTTKSPAGNTSNMAYKKSVFIGAGLFDENIYFTGCADWEFKIRIANMRYPVVYIPLNVLHKKEMTLKEFFFKSLRVGRGKDYCRKKYVELQAFAYYNPSLWRLIKEAQIWFADPETRPFWTIYFIHFFAGLCGRYLDTILRFRPLSQFAQYRSAERIFLHLKLPDGRVVKEEYMPYIYDQTKTDLNFGNRKIKKKKETFFSIIVPTFNRNSLILRTLFSLIGQTIPGDNYEIIIVDDGSTDETAVYIGQFIDSHPGYKIRYFRQENAGAAVARNRGIKESRGEIIFFTDDDCVVPDDWMEKMLQVYETYPEVVAVGGWAFAHSANASIFDKYRMSQAPPLKSLFFTNSPSQNVVCNTANLSVKKGILEKVGGFSEYLKSAGYEDYELGLRIPESGYTTVYLPCHVVRIKFLDMNDFVSLTKKRFENKLFLLQKKSRIPRNRIEIFTVPGLIIKIFDFLRRPSRFAIISILEYIIKFQIILQQEVDIKNFLSKSYLLHPDLPKIG